MFFVVNIRFFTIRGGSGNTPLDYLKTARLLHHRRSLRLRDLFYCQFIPHIAHSQDNRLFSPPDHDLHVLAFYSYTCYFDLGYIDTRGSCEHAHDNNRHLEIVPRTLTVHFVYKFAVLLGPAQHLQHGHLGLSNSRTKHLLHIGSLPRQKIEIRVFVFFFAGKLGNYRYIGDTLALKELAEVLRMKTTRHNDRCFSTAWCRLKLHVLKERIVSFEGIFIEFVYFSAIIVQLCDAPARPCAYFVLGSFSVDKGCEVLHIKGVNIIHIVTIIHLCQHEVEHVMRDSEIPRKEIEIALCVVLVQGFLYFSLEFIKFLHDLEAVNRLK